MAQSPTTTTDNDIDDELSATTTNMSSIPMVPKLHQHQHCRTCTTLIVVCPPRMACHLCHLPENDDITYYDNCIDSDIQLWKYHPNVYDVHSRSIGFPLQTTTTIATSSSCPPSAATPTTSTTTVSANDDSIQTTTTTHNVRPSSEYYLCTQGVGGSLTHFLIGNYHAIDLACPMGTPIRAVGNGTIVQVHFMNHNNKQNESDNNNNTRVVTGIAVSNLFHWNSIMLLLDDEECEDLNDTVGTDDSHATIATTSTAGSLYVEYVHNATSNVQIGEHVMEGQIIGTTGSVGFSPEPHLHIATYRSAQDAAPTCGFYFHTLTTNECGHRTKYQPVAGQWYNGHGLVNVISERDKVV